MPPAGRKSSLAAAQAEGLSWAQVRGAGRGGGGDLRLRRPTADALPPTRAGADTLRHGPPFSTPVPQPPQVEVGIVALGQPATQDQAEVVCSLMERFVRRVLGRAAPPGCQT